VQNGISTGIARLRTGTVRFDWTNTSIIAGQDQLFFSPLAPTSLDVASIIVAAERTERSRWPQSPKRWHAKMNPGLIDIE
jgi:hypothetical protein